MVWWVGKCSSLIFQLSWKYQSAPGHMCWERCAWSIKYFPIIITMIQEILETNIPLKNSVLSCSDMHTHKGLKSLLRLHQPRIVFPNIPHTEIRARPNESSFPSQKTTEQVQQRQIHSPKHKSHKSKSNSKVHKAKSRNRIKGEVPKQDKWWLNKCMIWNGRVVLSVALFHLQE